MTTFLTVKDAARHIGRSPSAVRRIIHPIIKDDQHPDRLHVQPSIQEARELRLKGENFAWRVSQELLDQRAPAKPRPDDRRATAGGAPADPALRELIGMLREQVQQSQKQLEVKDHQIASLTEITHNLNERLREGNILIGTLQRQLSLPAGDQRPTMVDAGTSHDAGSPSTKSGLKEHASKSPKAALKKPVPKGFFARLFR